MYRTLIDKSEKTTSELIALAEKRVAACFSDKFKEFCLAYNGAKFRNAEIRAKSSKLGQSGYEVREFWPIEKIGAVELEHWDENLIAFAEDSGGNFFVFHKSDMDSVYFLDHETDDKEIVSESFAEFLSDIIEAEYSDNATEPKNARGWINPAFLKKQKDLGNA